MLRVFYNHTDIEYKFKRYNRPYTWIEYQQNFLARHGTKMQFSVADPEGIPGILLNLPPRLPFLNIL